MKEQLLPLIDIGSFSTVLKYPLDEIKQESYQLKAVLVQLHRCTICSLFCKYLVPFMSLLIHIYLFQTVHMYIYLSIYLPSYLNLSIYLSIYLSIFVSFYLSIYLSIHISVNTCSYLSQFLHIYLSIYLSIPTPSLCQDMTQGQLLSAV